MRIFHSDFIIISHSRNPSSWRNPVITCSKEEAIEELKAIRQNIISSGSIMETFKYIAEKESDCSR